MNVVLDEEREHLWGVVRELEKDIEEQQAEIQQTRVDVDKEVTELQQDKVAVKEQLQQEIDRLHSEMERQQQRVHY